MPSFVKTERDERAWRAAKRKVKKSKGKPMSKFKDQDWGLVNKIFHSIKEKYAGGDLPDGPSYAENPGRPARLGGPGGGIPIEKARDQEVEFGADGQPQLRYTDLRPRNKALIPPDDNRKTSEPFAGDCGSMPAFPPDLLNFPGLGWPHETHKNRQIDTQMIKEERLPRVVNKTQGVLGKIEALTAPKAPKIAVKPPSPPAKPEPKAPKETEAPEGKDFKVPPPAPPSKAAKPEPKKDKIKFTPPKEKKGEEEDVVEPEMKAAKKPRFFNEVVSIVRSVFPQLKLKFPSPPTFIWNPKEGPEAKLDSKMIKDHLKVKFPSLVWTPKYDGAEVAEFVFEDKSTAEFAIGLEANHLTLTYNKFKS